MIKLMNIPTSKSVRALLLGLLVGTTSMIVGCSTENFGFYLTVDTLGDGTVAPGSGRHEAGTTVNLTATANPGWHFVEWHGLGTASGNTDTIGMDDNHMVGAVFERDPFTLGTSVIGQGTVSPESGTFDFEDKVTVTATPAENWHFVRWEGDASSGSDSIELTMDSDKTVVAVFENNGFTLSANDTLGQFG